MERILGRLHDLDVDPMFAFLSLSSLIKLGAGYLGRDRRPREAEHVGRVSQLILYPIKSLQGQELSEALCVGVGMKSGNLLDRHFQVVREMEGVYTSVNAKVTTVLMAVKLVSNGDKMKLEGPKGEKITFDWTQCVRNSQNNIKASTHGSLSMGIDCGDEVGSWFDELIGRSGHRLIYSGQDSQKRTVQNGTKNPKFLPWTKPVDPSHEMAFQDVTPFMIFNQASLDDLNTRLDRPVGVERVRPNIVVSGAPSYDEDTWKEMLVGEARFSTVKRCNRCPMTTVDTETGLRDSQQEPLRTLRTYRIDIEQLGTPILGMNVVLTKPGTVRVGDPVYVVRGETGIVPE